MSEDEKLRNKNSRHCPSCPNVHCDRNGPKKSPRNHLVFVVVMIFFTLKKTFFSVSSTILREKRRPMVTQVFTRFLLISVVVVVVVVAVVVVVFVVVEGLIGTPALFRLPEPSAPEPEKGFQLAKSVCTNSAIVCEQTVLNNVLDTHTNTMSYTLCQLCGTSIIPVALFQQIANQCHPFFKNTVFVFVKVFAACETTTGITYVAHQCSFSALHLV